MARFLKGNELNSEIEKIFENAENLIILISPYIKLHDRYCSTLLTKVQNPNIEVIVLFGKNENDLSKSMKQTDFDFFKQFPNIEIRHEERLHAKYYANENKAIITSMNLYDYSQNNNIEVGVLVKSSFKGYYTGDNGIDKESWNYFYNVIGQAELLFKKEPKFKKNKILFSEKYIKSEIVEDKLSDFFNNKNYEKVYKKKIQTQKPKIKSENINPTSKNIGFCIRTGKEIPFNIEKPLSYEAFKMWNKYKNPDYPEKYCHFTGELSYGKTSVNKPILNKNWKKAKEKYNL